MIFFFNQYYAYPFYLQLLADDVKTELSEDPMALEKIVKFHMVPSQQLACKHLHNNLRLDTLDSDRQILIKEYYSVRTTTAK